MADPSPLPISPPCRLLVRGVNWLGDAVMTTPALLRLREHLPQVHLALLTPAKLGELWQGHPALDSVLSFAPGESVFAVARRLRAGGFDTALVLPNSPRSALEVWLARIPRRIGYARRWRNLFLTHAIPTRPGHVAMRKRSVGEIKRLAARSDVAAGGAGLLSTAATGSRAGTLDSIAHQIHEYLHLAARLGADASPVAPLLRVGEEEVAAAKVRFGLEREAGPLLALNPGAEYGPAKRWPAERFVAAACEVQRRVGGTWIVLGGAGDVALAELVVSNIGEAGGVARNLAGRTSLRDLMALLKAARVLLSNDSGPMHVAAALGTPVVALFGSTSPELTSPGLPGEARHRLLSARVRCAPCFRRSCPIDLRCMRELRVEQVVAAVLETLGS